jgi:Ca2+-dependent lipid-binding protein
VKANAKTCVKVAFCVIFHLLKLISGNMMNMPSLDNNHEEESTVTEMDLEIYRYQVAVLCGRNLIKSDFLGKSDPYVKITVGKVTHSTRIIKKDLNPVWNEQFAFNAEKASEVKFEVFDWDQHSKDDCIGTVSVAHSEISSETRVHGKFVSTLQLEHVSHGEIDVMIWYKKIPVDWTERSLKLAQKKNVEFMKENQVLKREVEFLKQRLDEMKQTVGEHKHSDTVHKYKLPEREQKVVVQDELTRMPFDPYRELYKFEVQVLSAEHLSAHDFNGKSDPYCIVKIGEQVRQTETVYESLTPVWKSNMFHFICESVPSEIKFTVMDWNTFVHSQLGETQVSVAELFADDSSTGRMNLQLQLNPKGSIHVVITYFKLVTQGC